MAAHRGLCTLSCGFWAEAEMPAPVLQPLRHHLRQDVSSPWGALCDPWHKGQTDTCSKGLPAACPGVGLSGSQSSSHRLAQL